MNYKRLLSALTGLALLLSLLPAPALAQSLTAEPPSGVDVATPETAMADGEDPAGPSAPTGSPTPAPADEPSGSPTPAGTPTAEPTNTPAATGEPVPSGTATPETALTAGEQLLALADEPQTEGDFTVTGNADGYTYENNVLTILDGANITIKMSDDVTTTTTDTILVEKDASAKITLAGVNIDVSTTSGKAAFKIADDSTGNVTITLADNTENTLKSGSNCAGLQKNGSDENVGTLTIQGGKTGNGTLTAASYMSGAGIGGGSYGSSRNITISGGTVTANGGDIYDAAGIGGGYNGDGSYITITGGKVTANGGRGGGAGIGGGYKGSGSYIEITGGEVTANGGTNGAGIGGGSSGGSSSKDKGNGSHITISGGTVTAKGGVCAAGIGGGFGSFNRSTGNGSGSDIQITGGFVIAQGGAAYDSDCAGAAIGNGSYYYDYDPAPGEELDDPFIYAEGKELDISPANCVVLKQRGSESVVTGQVYGEPTLTADATLPSGASLTIPEGAVLTVGADATLTNSGAICVEGGSLQYGEPDYGTLTGDGTICYLLTVVGGTATKGTATYNGKTYAEANASVTLTADTKVGLKFNGAWTTSRDGFTVTDNQFIMPAQVLTVTAGDYTNDPAYTVTIPGSVDIGGDAVVTAKDVAVAEGYNLYVKLTDTSDTNDKFTLALEGYPEETLGYTVTNGTGANASAVGIGDTILTVAGGKEGSSGSATLSFALADGAVAKYSGTYTGTVTFTVSVTETNSG